MFSIDNALFGTVPMSSKRRPLTADEIVWKDNLKAIYSRKKKELGLTQEKLADLCGWKTQASVSNYMNGVIPLNTDAKLKLAKALQVSVSEIDVKMSGSDFGGSIPTNAEEFFAKYGEYLENLPMKEQMRVVGRIEAIVDKHLAMAREDKATD